MQIFNNRELAIIIWLIIAVIATLFKKELRECYLNILQALFSKPLIKFYSYLLIYTALIVFLLEQIGFWQAIHLKNTMIWFLFVAAVSASKAINIENEQFFKDWLKANFTVFIIVEYIVASHSFSLPVELVFQPALFMLGALAVFTEANEEHRPLSKFFYSVIGLTVLVLIYFGLTDVTNDVSGFFNFNTLSEILLTIILSLLLIPFLYLTYLITSYSRILQGASNFIKDKPLFNYFRFKATVASLCNIKKLERLKRNICLHNIESRQDIDEVMRLQKIIKEREKKPPAVKPKDGWCPYVLTHILSEHSLSLNDYHKIYEETWHASATPLRLESDVFAYNQIWFSVSGNFDAVTEINLTLDVGNSVDKEESEKKFSEALQYLIDALFVDSELIADELLDQELQDYEVNQYVRLEFALTSWPNENQGYSKKAVFTNA